MVEKAFNHLAKKLLGEEGEAKDKQRVIHDLSANGLEANPYVINEKAQWYGKRPMRSDEDRSKQGIIQKSDEDRRRNSDFKLIRYSLEEFKKYILKEMDTTDVKLKNFHKQYNITENTLQVKDFLTEEEEFRRLKEEAIKDGMVREDH